MIHNAQGFHISGGQFNSDKAGDQYQSADPILALWRAIEDVGASHDSATRYPAPKCHPNTCQEVQNVIYDWIHSPSPENQVFWLYGPAGAGKSAIAQTIAETAQQKGYLASSFFFSRTDPKRNTAGSLFLIVAYGLAISIPELRVPIGQAIEKDPAVLRASLEEQFEKLIVEPCKTLKQLHGPSWLIVVDGLDECSGSRYAKQEQQRILFIIAKAMAALMRCIRLRFLICSRPEPPIREAFDTDGFRWLLHRIALDNTFETSRDMVIFLTAEFKRIRTSPRNHHIRFPIPWPAPGVVDELVQKASGQFIYAATVIKFVDNEYTNPRTQLELVLHTGPRPNPELESPFSDLDVLYHQILSCNPQRSRLREILRAVVIFQGQTRTYCLNPTPLHIEALLMICEEDVITALRGMHSVLDIRGPGDIIYIFHASFSDFLTDARRSRQFFVGDEQDQYSFLACHTLQAIDHYSQICGGNDQMLSLAQRVIFHFAWYDWASYCLKAKLDSHTLHALSNANFTQSLGTYILDHLTCRNGIASFRIQAFFWQTCRLLSNLQIDSGVHANVARRFWDYMRGFRIWVPRSVEISAVDSLLDESASLLVRDLLRDSMSKDARRKFSNSWLVHCRIVSIGNDCSCTRAKEASSRLSLPCSESPSGDVHHIQLSAAMRDVVRQELRQLGQAHTAFAPDPLFRLLSICKPCPELLNLLPPLLPKIIWKVDQNLLLRWLKSFPPEYASCTSPLIQEVRDLDWRLAAFRFGVYG
ncbi:nwd2 [Moniliophthora roreri]|uniref:NACHT domain-containing protein n=1 Tax=Moniliophthora roreri TaxID=221103 RepID=A0A0W0G858_MONRR|nr:nwd2 [Moniliophthora roreri]